MDVKSCLRAMPLLISGTLLGCSTPPSSSTPDASPPRPDAGPRKSYAECMAAALVQLQADQKSGVTEVEASRKYVLSSQRCITPGWSDEKNQLAAAINEDYRRAGAELLGKRMRPGAYLDLRRDRARKFQLAIKEPSLATELASGDEDRDLVPDRRDRCPKTPLLSATDDQGCPTAGRTEKTAEECVSLLEAWHTSGGTQPPYECLVDEAIDQAMVTWHPKCDGADAPSTPVPLVAYPVAEGFYVLSQVKNQPAGCPIMYEVELACIYSGGSKKPWYEREIFSGTADQDAAADLARFAFGTGHPTPGLTHVDVEYDRTYRWRARAINGNGQKSPWSDWQGKLCPNHSLCKD